MQVLYLLRLQHNTKTLHSPDAHLTFTGRKEYDCSTSNARNRPAANTFVD